MIYATDQLTGHPWEFKWQRILAAFMDGKSWNTIDAVQRLHTTCLHSDISGLRKRHGLKFKHERITVAGYGGVKTPVVSYTLLPESYPAARRLLGMDGPHNPPQGDAARAYLLASSGSRA